MYKQLQITLAALVLPFIAFGQDFKQSYFQENGIYLSEHIDSDGKEDLVREKYVFSSSLQFLKNDYAADNKFTLVATVPLSEIESNIVSLDYDLDGDNDFVVSDATPKALMLIKNEGNNVFKSEKLNLKPATMLLTGDSDKDGIKEIYAFDNRTKAIEVITIKDKVFTAKVISTNLFVSAMALVNLNSSPQDELLVAPSDLANLTLGYIEKTGTTYTYKVSPLSIPKDELNRMMIWDMNKDGYKDIVTAGEDGLSTFLIDKNGVGTLKILQAYKGSKSFGYTALG